MLKLLDYESVTDKQQNLYTLRPSGGMLTKHASANAGFSRDIAEFISKLIPKDDHHYSLCTALGAGEYWSSNINGDFFEKDELIKNHHTFLRGTPFMHHENKDPTKGYGEIIFSTYNPRMNRVELIIGYDTTKLPQNIVKKLINDELVNLSMGCRVKYDICSICGNRAPQPKDYCDHVTKVGLNTIYPDGRKVFVYNPDPDFFDISIVIVPADKTACILSNIFNKKIEMPKTAKSDPMRGFRQIIRPSSVNAQIAKTASVSHAPYEAIPNRSWEEILKLARDTKTPDCLIASIKKAGAYLKPNEAQAVLFAQEGRFKIAKSLLEQNAYFECDAQLPLVVSETAPVSINNAFNKVASIIQASGPVPLTKLAVDNSVLGLSANDLNDISRISMLSAVVGAAMANDWGAILPIIGLGAAVAASSMTNDRSALLASTAEAARQQELNRDLYLAPLIRAKKASKNLTLNEIYTISLRV